MDRAMSALAPIDSLGPFGKGSVSVKDELVGESWIDEAFLFGRRRKWLRTCTRLVESGEIDTFVLSLGVPMMKWLTSFVVFTILRDNIDIQPQSNFSYIVTRK